MLTLGVQPCSVGVTRKGRVVMKFTSHGKTYYFRNSNSYNGRNYTSHRENVVVEKGDLLALRLGNIIGMIPSHILGISYVLTIPITMTFLIFAIPTLMGYDSVVAGGIISFFLWAFFVPIAVKSYKMSKGNYPFVVEGYDTHVLEDLVKSEAPLAQEVIDMYFSVGKDMKSEAFKQVERARGIIEKQSTTPNEMLIDELKALEGE